MNRSAALPPAFAPTRHAVVLPALASGSPPPRRSRLRGRLLRYRRPATVLGADTGGQERECLAQFVHDQLGGLVVQLRLAYGAWQQGATPPGATAPGAAFGALLAELSGTLRRLSFALAPPDWHDDLQTALESVAAELRLRGSLPVGFDAAGLQGPGLNALPAAARHVVCRVVRELGLNVLKHAGASRVRIQAGVVDRELRIDVQDDGCGPPAARAAVGLGLRSARAQLRALGGSLALVPGRDGGSCASLRLPLDAQGAAADPSAGGRP